MKSKLEVEAFFAKWITENSPVEGEDEDEELQQLQECLATLRKKNLNQLLKHVTEVNVNGEAFNMFWTKNRTHVLGVSLYVDLRKWLGAGKW